MNNNLLNGRRFADILRLDLRNDYRSIIIKLASIIGAMAFVMMVMNLNYYGQSDFRHHSLLITFKIFFVVGTVVMASFFGRGNSTPGERLNNLMVPASTLEKYLSRFLIYTLGAMAAICLCWTVSDLGRYVVESLWPGVRVTPPVWFWEGLCMDTDTWLLLLVTQATFLLGSVIWVRLPLLKTIVALWIIQSVYGLIATITVSVIFHNMEYTGFAESPVDILKMEYLAGWTLAVLCILWSIFCYVMAYMRMTEQEIINRH